MSPTAPSDVHQPRRAHRASEGAMIGGVAAGLAEHLGVDVLLVRIALVVSAFAAGSGLLFYAGLWLVLPAQRHFERSAPGLESASRSGYRPGRALTWADAGTFIALGTVVVGVMMLVGGTFGPLAFVWPLGMVVAGIALMWWQADQAQRERWWDDQGEVTPFRALMGQGSAASYARVFGGLGLVVLGVMTFVLGTGNIQGALAVGAVTLVALVALIVILGPLLFRLASDLTEERAERVRTQERADVAAHLHDSVLQTLALIQKSADDPVTVARLARAQERDLRSWLYDDAPAGAETAAGQLRAIAAEVEDTFAVPIEAVCVGDSPEIDPALVAATREALANASRHSGAPKVDLYAEIRADSTEVFVRDRGQGFVIDEIAHDRHGVRGSIIDRMQRHGGTAMVNTRPGQGTEIRLAMPKKEES